MKRRSWAFHPKRPARAQLPADFPAEGKAAHISGFPEFAGVTSFPDREWPALEAFAPSVLIGYAFDLRRLARVVKQRDLVLSTVDRAIFVLTDCGSLLLNEPTRELLWQTFGVPSYEWIIGNGCRLLATECALHSGWHVQPGIRAFSVKGEILYDAPPVTAAHSGFTGRLDLHPCPCGRPTSLLRGLTPYVPDLHGRALPELLSKPA